jgi:hypothetical protein
MCTKRKGNIGEAKVIADLLEQGIEVAMPFGDNLPFDLIAVDPDLGLWKAQVKFARACHGVIRIKNWRQGIISSTHHTSQEQAEGRCSLASRL